MKNMEIVVKKEELVQKLIDQFVANVVKSCQDNNLTEEETQAHIIVNKRKIIQDASNIASLVFVAYGVVDAPVDTAEEKAEDNVVS